MIKFPVLQVVYAAIKFRRFMINRHKHVEANKDVFTDTQLKDYVLRAYREVNKYNISHPKNFISPHDLHNSVEYELKTCVPIKNFLEILRSEDERPKKTRIP